MLEGTDALRVTSLSRTSNRRKRTPRTIERADYDTTIARDQAAIQEVHEMRDEIDRKEAEVARLREQLERDNEVDMTKAPTELKRLQAAFDQVQRMCAERMAPVTQRLQDACAKCEAGHKYVAEMGNVCKERASALESLDAIVQRRTGELDEPTVRLVDETPLRDLVAEGMKITSDVDGQTRTAVLEAHRRDKLHRLNKDLERQLKDAIAAEEQAERRAETAKKDIDVRCSRPKVVKIDSDWIKENKMLSMNVLKLKEVSNGSRMFTEEISRLADENRAHNETIGELRDESAELQRYMPDGGHTDVRTEATAKTTTGDVLRVKIVVATEKRAIETGRAEAANATLEKQKKGVGERKAALEKAKEKRAEVDRELENVQTIRADLVAQKEFVEDERANMEQRIRSGREKLAEIQEQTAQLNETLAKQLKMIAMSEELMALRKTDLGRVARIVSNVIQINSDMV